MASLTLVDTKRAYYGAELGYTGAALASKSLQDLELEFFAPTGPGGVQTNLKDWALSDTYRIVGGTVFDVNGILTSANIQWPDGSLGVFTTTTANPTFGTIDAYTITHVNSGLTVTQPAVTRNGAGAITAQPALTIA